MTKKTEPKMAEVFELPLRWEVYEGIWIRDGNDKGVILVGWDTPEHEAYSRAIVCAVNEYDEMRELLQAAMIDKDLPKCSNQWRNRVFALGIQTFKTGNSKLVGDG